MATQERIISNCPISVLFVEEFCGENTHLMDLAFSNMNPFSDPVPFSLDANQMNPTEDQKKEILNRWRKQLNHFIRQLVGEVA